MDDADVEAMGDHNPVQDRLVDGTIRAARGTGAGVRVVPHLAALPEGLGAILRRGGREVTA